MYPVKFSVAYPDRPLNRLTTFFRIFTAIPILVVIAVLEGHTSGLVIFPTLFLILFRQKYPRWWFDWNLQLMRFSARICAYLALMDDNYPSTDEEQSVTLELSYPDARNDLNRWLPLVKWLLAIPHFIILVFLSLAAIVCVVFAWFAILVTARYPRGLFEFVEGVFRWWNRVIAYAFVLVTDEYPPFSLSA